MPQTALLNLGLNYDYDAGADGWKAGVDNNWVLLDSLAQGVVIDVRNAQPGSPADGDRYIIGPSASGASWAGNSNGVAAYYTAVGWVIQTPLEGWWVYDQTENVFRIWDGTAWRPQWDRLLRTRVKTEAGSTYTFALGDSLTLGDAHTLVEFSFAGTKTVTVDTAANQAFEVGTKIWVVGTGSGRIDIVAATGVTFRGNLVGQDSGGNDVLTVPDPGIVAQLHKVAADTWELSLESFAPRARGQLTTNVTIAARDFGATLEMNTAAAARDVTIPQDSADDLPIGFYCYVVNSSGTNNVTFTTTGLTTRGVASLTTDRARVRLVKVNANTWISG